MILTGAGISAESGIKTFRDANGLWENHRIEDVASPEGFQRNPVLVQQFYNQRRRQLHEPSVQPNAAHVALARLESEWEGDFLLVTQNVDNLHERAGSKRLLHMHGKLNSALCTSCEQRMEWIEDISSESNCRVCHARGTLRPDIVWFGEMPYFMESITDRLERCDLFLSIGTSGQVYPAAGFARQAAHAYRVEINLEPSKVSHAFHDHRYGKASEEVEKFLANLQR